MILTAILLISPAVTLADQIIFKDGKIISGRIMGEGERSILVSQPGKPPQFFALSDIMTIVREKNPEIPNPDRDRFIHLELDLTGQFHNSGQIQLSPAPGLGMVAGFRLHPLLQVEGAMDWTPAVSGRLTVTDGTVFRRYERFYRWNAGFGLRIYPLATRWKSSWEPYMLGGYRWSRMTAKDSGDFVKGSSWNVGAGISKALSRHLFWENRLVYGNASYEKIQFLLRQGSLNPSIDVATWSLQTGLSLRL